MLISLLLSLLATFLAIFIAFKVGVSGKLFVLVVALLPIAYFYEIHFSILSFLKVFLAIYVFCLFWLSTLGRRHLYVELDVLLAFFLFFTAYFLTLYINQLASYGSLMRDLIPLLFFFIAVLFNVMIKDDMKFSIESLKKVVIYAVIFDFIFYLAVYKLNIVPTGIRGEFYLRTGIVRYSDLFSLTLFSMASLFYFKYKESRFKWLLVMVLISAMSLDRVFLLWSIFITFHFFITLPNLVFRWGFYLLVAFGFTVLSSLIVTLNHENEVFSRFLDLMSLELIYHSLYQRFAEPAILGGYELSFSTFFLGMGAGFEFYIPWFIYRDLNPSQISVDSFFVANYIKYGVIGLGVLTYLVLKPFFSLSVKSFLWLPIYLIVHNGILVDSFILIIIFISLIKKEELGLNNEC